MSSWKDLPVVEQKRGDWRDLPEVASPDDGDLLTKAGAAVEKATAADNPDIQRTRRVLNKALFGQVPNIAGTLDALPALVTPGKDFSQEVLKNTAEYERAYQDAGKPSEGEDLVGSMLQPIPGPGKFAKPLARLGAYFVGGAASQGLNALAEGEGAAEIAKRAVIGGGLTSVLGPAVDKGAALLGRGAKFAQGKLGEAYEHAMAMGAKKAADETRSTVSHAGGETVKAMNIAKTLKAMPDAPQARSPEEYAEMLERAADSAARKSSTLRGDVAASRSPQVGRGVETEFASKARGVVDAQKSGVRADFYEQAYHQLMDKARAARQSKQLPANTLESLRREAVDSPEFAELTENAIANMVSDLPHEAARARAAREAASAAVESQGARAAKYGQENLDPTAFLKGPVMDRVRRYGLPAAGVAIGDQFDSPELGLLAGGGLSALAGQGVRPMLQSVARAGNHPVAQTMLWGSVENILRRASGTPYEATLQKAALTQGPGAVTAIHNVLKSRVPGYAAMFDQEELPPDAEANR
jgi:hypothetical protein